MKKSGDYIVFSAWAGILASITDLVSMIVFSMRQGYSPLNDIVSSLGASNSPVSNQLSAIWVVVGVLLIFFGIGFGKAFSERGRFAKIASWLIMLYGFGEGIGSGIFKYDRVGNVLTTSGILHDIMGGIGVVSFLFLSLIIPKVITREESPSFHSLSVFLFISGFIFVFLFLLRYVTNESNFFFVYKGLWQRLFILIIYIYLLNIAIFMIKRHQKQQMI